MGEQLPVRSKPQGEVQFGGALKKDFPFDPEWHNLNHGECTFTPADVSRGPLGNPLNCAH